jgi:TetR/AcrR family transcriptional regulator, cholesterol catabolism regulator
MSNATAGLARGRRRNAGRRDEILRVAARVFSQHGFRQATLDDIASELRITRPALYYYADSKDKLLSECGEIATRQLDDALQEAQKASLGLEQVRTFFKRYAEFVCDDFGRCFVLTSLSEMSEQERESKKQAQLVLARSVTAMIRKAIRDGSMRRCDSADVSRALFAAFYGIPRWYKPGRGRTPAKIADDFLDLFVEGLRPRLARAAR